MPQRLVEHCTAHSGLARCAICKHIDRASVIETTGISRYLPTHRFRDNRVIRVLGNDNLGCVSPPLRSLLNSSLHTLKRDFGRSRNCATLSKGAFAWGNSYATTQNLNIIKLSFDFFIKKSVNKVFFNLTEIVIFGLKVKILVTNILQNCFCFNLAKFIAKLKGNFCCCFRCLFNALRLLSLSVATNLFVTQAIPKVYDLLSRFWRCPVR